MSDRPVSTRPARSYPAAAVILSERDPVLRRLVAETGPPRVRPPTETHFAALVRSILYQQLAGAAAAAIHGRLIAALRGEVTPERLLSLSAETLRSVGLSANKAASLQDLATKVLDGTVVLDPSRLRAESDEEVVARLSTVRGIGKWTAEMFLMFQLRRLDVWPTGDLGVRKGFGLAWGIPTPTAKDLEPLGEPYQPYRSVVAWYCWRAAELYAGAADSALTAEPRRAPGRAAGGMAHGEFCDSVIAESGAGMASQLGLARQQSISDMLHRTASRVPGKLAIVSGATRLTFAELEAAVSRSAAALAAEGLKKGDRLALLSHNCWQFVVLSFATARLGVVLVPVNFMLGPAEIAYILNHSEAAAFVAEDGLAATAGKAIAAAGSGISVRAVIRLSGCDVPAGWADVQQWIDREGTPPQVDVADDDLLRLMYTSGTESRPKGAMLSSRSLMWQYVSCIIDGGMDGDDVEVHSMPLYHCAQLDCFLGPDVYVGATSIVLPAPDPAAMLTAIESERATKLFCPPTVWIGLLRSPEFGHADLSSLRKGYYGASAMPVEVLRELRERLPHIRLWNFYGQTEMAPLATILGPDEQVSRAGSAGRAALNVETRLVDDNDVAVPPGIVGEIVHRSPHATLGYYKDDAMTATAFRSGWFHSGDLGVMTEDGYLTVVDRKKDMIKTGGENVASREVEEAIYRMDGVAEVAVFGVAHPRWVEAVVAVVVPKPGATLTEAAVIKHTREVLAGYKTPKRVVIAGAVPKNPSGKILKRQLRKELKDIAAHA